MGRETLIPQRLFRGCVAGWGVEDENLCMRARLALLRDCAWKIHRGRAFISHKYPVQIADITIPSDSYHFTDFPESPMNVMPSRRLKLTGPQSDEITFYLDAYTVRPGQSNTELKVMIFKITTEHHPSTRSLRVYWEGFCTLCKTLI